MMHEILKRFTNYTYVGVCTKVYGGVNDARNIEMIYKFRMTSFFETDFNKSN